MLHTRKVVNVTMANKKFTKVAALLLLSVFGLTACDNEVVSKPSNYDEPIITITEDGKEVEIYNNLLSIIYDGIRDGSLASDVLDKVLYEYSVSVLGRYNKVGLKTELADGEYTLKEAARAATNGNADVVNAFVKAHKAYWSVDSDGNRVDDNGNQVSEDAPASERETARVKMKWATIEERIAEAMYAKISGGSYSERNIFSEKKFLASLKFDYKKVEDYKTATCFEGLLTPDVEEKEVFTKGLLHRENYQFNSGLDEDESDAEISYIEDEIIPTIYRSLLTEQYILDETYNTLGKAAARKVNVLTITNNDKYDEAAPYLMKSLVETINTKGSNVSLDTLKTYANVWKGVDLSTEEQTIANALLDPKCGAFKTGKVVDSEGHVLEEYIKGTKYGDMMDNYLKINDDPLLTDTSIESDFTGSNTYSKETGKLIKTREIQLGDYTTTGWFTKNTGVDGLPSTITSRLFSFDVATALDRTDKDYDRWQGDEYSAKNDYNEYVAKINGKYYFIYSIRFIIITTI